MSDLIGRIAARAVGAPALAQPRAAAPLLDADRLDVVDEEAVAPAAAPVRAEPVAASPAPARTAAAGHAEPREPAAAPTKTHEVQPAATSPGPAAEERSRRERPLPALERAPVDPTGAELGPPPAEPRVAAQVLPVAATPAVPISTPAHRVAHRGATAAHGYNGPAEPPPVRVHIGRLEVRASVQEQPRPALPPRPSEPEGLSLSDYLRGRR